MSVPTSTPSRKGTREALSVDAVLRELDGVRETGVDRWIALCPAHDDHDPSLSVRQVDGKICLRCFAGCPTSAVVAALGLPAVALSTTGTLDAAVERTARRLDGCVVARWTYADSTGGPVLVVVRFETSDGKSYRPFKLTSDGWRAGAPPGLLPLYRLPELTDQARVYVVEGEKAADALWRIGLPATTSAFGAKSPMKTDWKPLAGRDVVILPDNDEAGRRYAARVTQILTELNRGSH